jgi:hypothetical protein
MEGAVVIGLKECELGLNPTVAVLNSGELESYKKLVNSIHHSTGQFDDEGTQRLKL